MPFIARILIPDWEIPARAYLHGSGLNVFNQRSAEFWKPLSAADYLAKDVLNGHSELFQPSKYLIVALFGKEGNRMAEVFGYGDFAEWPGNPTKYRWTFREGVYLPQEKEDGCGDTDIILGVEEKCRRNPRIRDIDEFMRSPPPVEDMSPCGDYFAEFSIDGRVVRLDNHAVFY